MGKFGRREGNENKMKAKLRHSLLSVVIFDHQEVCSNAKPFVASLHNAAVSLANWSLREENMAIQDACTRMYEITCLTSTVIEEFSKQYFEFGRSLKNLLCREMDLDNLRKQVWQLEERTTKLRKQNMEKEAKEKEKRKEAGSKRLSLLEDLGNAELAYEEQKASVDAQTTKHEILKGKHLQETVSQLAASTMLLGKRLSTIGCAQNELANAIPVVPTQMAKSDIYQGSEFFDEVVQKAADSLQLTRPQPFIEFQKAKDCRKTSPAFCRFPPSSEHTAEEWIMVDMLEDLDTKGQVWKDRHGRLEQQAMDSLKGRLAISNTNGRSYILNMNVAQRQLMKHHRLQSESSEVAARRPPVPPPRGMVCPPKPPRTPLPRPRTSQVDTPEQEAEVDYPRVEPYAITRPHPNSQGLYARANLFSPTMKRLCRSWSGEEKWWTRDEDSGGYVQSNDPQIHQSSNDDKELEEVVYAVLEQDDEQTLNNQPDYLVVLK